MHDTQLVTTLTEALATIPLLDAHTHLAGGRLSAQGLHDIVLYHMVISDLYAAGCPAGARLTPYPNWPDQDEAHARLREALPYLPFIRNTSGWWGVRTILHDLYAWDEPITADNWQALDALIRERADDRAWAREIMRRANIQRACTEIARREVGQDDDVLSYSLEWAFFTRCQYGEYDTALYELERCWGQTPDTPLPVNAHGRPPTVRTIHTLDDVHAALDHYVKAIPYEQLLSMATHISTDLYLTPVSEAAMASALTRRGQAGPAERDMYAAYIHEVFLTALEPYANRLVFQFSFGAEPLPHETASRLSQRAIAQLADSIARHPKIRFQCLLASRHANQALCSLCRELPNLSLAGYWWHNFFPSAMRQVMDERLDMLPMNKQIGFFSDAYTLEWAYAKSMIVRAQLVQVLAHKIGQGQYTIDDALIIARAIFYETPQALLGMPGE